MKDYKNVICYLQSNIKSIFIKSIWLLILLDSIEFLSKWQLLKESEPQQIQLSFSLTHQIFLMLFLFVSGYLFTSHQFSGYISIYANRKTYLGAVLIYSMGISCGGAIMMWALAGILNYSIGSICNMPYICVNINNLWATILISLLCISGGLALGAVYYRLHIRSFILGLCSLTFIGIKLYEKYQMLAWYERISLPSIEAVSLMGSPILLLITWLCLQRAPIKAYAHSWL